MGLKLRQDVLKPLQESGGNIILPNSLVTLRDVNAIEGQQFETGSLQVAGNFASLPAITLHFVYLVAPAGVPQLVVSTNVNSVGPAGFNAWRLVGAFYTDSLSTVGFGSFLNIEGKPETLDAISFDLQINDVNEVNVMSGSPVTVFGEWKRIGNEIGIAFAYYHTTTAGSSGSPGLYHIHGPGFVAAATIKPGASNTGHVHGPSRGDVGGGSPSSFSSVPVASQTYFRVRNRVGEGQTSVLGFQPGTTYDMGNTFVGITGSIIYPIQGWSNTPLKDL